MLGVETIAKIRRAYFAQRMTIKAIWRDLHLVAAEIRCGRRQRGRSERQTSHLHALPEEPMEIDPKLECHRTPARRVQAADQGADRFAERETAAMLFWALLASGQITMRKVDGWRSLGSLTSPHELLISSRWKPPKSFPVPIATTSISSNHPVATAR
jgi:hypothetical protein